VRFPLPTPKTLAAGGKTHRRAPGAYGDAGDLLADLDDIAAEFMAEDGPVVAVFFVPV